MNQPPRTPKSSGVPDEELGQASAQALGLLRKTLRERRLALSEAERLRLSRLVCERFLSEWATLGLADGAPGSELGAKTLRVALYRPFQGELLLETLERRWEPEPGVSLHYPVAVRSEIEMRQVSRPSRYSWEIGRFGIEEPGAEAPVAEPGTLDLIVVPGVAFGLGGERVGYGGGFYDRYLEKIGVARSPGGAALLVALCYDFQLFPALAQGPRDQRVDWVLTETRSSRSPGFPSKIASLLAGQKG